MPQVLPIATRLRGGRLAIDTRIERLLSIHTTCRLQHRPLHDYLIDALSAHTRGDPTPLLA